jgi:hypothetical protein
MDYTNHSLFSFAYIYSSLFFCLSCIRCYGLKSLQNKIQKQSQICFWFLVVVVGDGGWRCLCSSSCDLWRVVSSEDSHMEKSIEQHLHANERELLWLLFCYACMQRFDIHQFAWSNLSKPHTIVGHKGVGAKGGGGRDGFFARMGRWHLWTNCQYIFH